MTLTRRSWPLLSVATAAVLALPSAGQAYERLPRPLAALSPADFASRMRVVDDPSSQSIVLSTREGYDRARRVGGAHVEDVHLRALVDRATGRVTWQVWHELVTASQNRGIAAIRYTANGRIQTARPITVDHWRDECPPTDGIGACSHFTRVGFELPESALRELAAAYEAGSRRPWRVRFEDPSGRAVTSGIAPAEAAGLVQALDEWRRHARQSGAG